MSGWGRGGQRHLLATAFLFCHLAAVGWAASWSIAKGPPSRSSHEHQHVPISAKVGGQVRITCPVHGDPEPIVEWYREGERVKEYSDRYRLSDLSLVIKQFECDDEGTYVCKAINGYGTIEVVFILEIERSKDNNCRQQDEDEVTHLDDDSETGFPVISQLRKSDKHVLKPAGSQVSIKCSATGKPSLVILWFKDGVEIKRWDKKYTIKETTSKSGRLDSDEAEDDDEDGSRRQVVRSELEIANVTRSDMANYTCRAANDHGTADLTIFLEVVERQEPRDPELHPQYPVNSSFAAGQPASLSCKAKSEFPPELHWLKRLSDSSPPLDGDVEVGADPRNTVFDNMTPNKTISYGNARYLILPSPKPVMVDGYYLSKLTFAQVSAETDAGVYVCVVFNDSGFTHRVVNLTVFHSPKSEVDGKSETGSAVTNSAMSEVDSTTTAVVIFVVIVGLGTMVAVCLAWKRRSKHVKDNFLSGVAAPKSSTSSVSVQITRDPQPLPASDNGTLSSPVTYPIFRDGLCGAELGSSREASGASYGPVLNQGNGETVYYFNGRSSRRNNPPRRSHRSPRGPRASHRHRADDFHKRRIPPMTAPPRGSFTSEETGAQLPITWEKRSARLARPSPESSFDNGSLLL